MFGLDRLALQLIGIAVLLLSIGGAVIWYGSTRYDAGMAAERQHWEDVIRKANLTIDNLNRQADEAKIDRDRAISDLAESAGKVEIVAVPVEVSRRCDMPEPARRALNAINVKRGAP